MSQQRTLNFRISRAHTIIDNMLVGQFHKYRQETITFLLAIVAATCIVHDIHQVY